jgi:hypothetical protein
MATELSWSPTSHTKTEAVVETWIDQTERRTWILAEVVTELRIKRTVEAL